MTVPCVSGIREDLPLNFAERNTCCLITPIRHSQVPKDRFYS